MKQTYTWLYRIKSNFKLKIHYHDQFHGFFKLVVFANSSWWNWNFKGNTMIHHKQILQQKNKELISTDHESSLHAFSSITQQDWGGSTFFAVKPTGAVPVPGHQASSPDLILCLKLEVWQLNQLSSVAGNFLSWVEAQLLKIRCVWSAWKSCTVEDDKWISRFYPWRYKDRNGARLRNWRDGCICQYNILIERCLEIKNLIKPTHTPIFDSQLHEHFYIIYIIDIPVCHHFEASVYQPST